MRRISCSLFLPTLFALAGCDTALVIGEQDPAAGTACAEPGATRPARDACNTCTCTDDGTWQCTTEACTAPACVPGATRAAGDGCNRCTCGADGTWTCTERTCTEPPTCANGGLPAPQGDDCGTCTCAADGTWRCTNTACEAACTVGETRVADDGCNTCSCIMVPDVGATWSCAAEPCVEPPPVCNTYLPLTQNLITADAWIGRRPDQSVDVWAGLGGPVYAFGDGIACSPDPLANPCDASGCHLTGATIFDDTFAAWGCGLGVVLRAEGEPLVKQPYSGPADCFRLRLTGTSGGADVRAQLTTNAESTGAALTHDLGPVDGYLDATVCMADFTCPQWGEQAGLCSPSQVPLTSAYDLQVVVAGGMTAAPVDLTLEVLVGAACSTALCAPGETQVDGCNVCTCSADGTWACDDAACTSCEAGQVWDVDACTRCTCDATGQGTCTSLCAATCAEPSENLVDASGWVGGAPELAEDNPAGIQGAFYTFGDPIACPQPNTNPCTDAGCFLRGTTVFDPTYEAWGCGLGLQLAGTGTGEPPVTPYPGLAECFQLDLVGNSGENPLRLAFSQGPSPVGATTVAPYVQIPPLAGSWSGTVCTSDVTCPEWAGDTCSITGQVYDLQVIVPGGDRTSNVSVGITRLVACGG